MSKTTLRIMTALLAGIVLVSGVYIVINRPPPATRTASEIDAVADACRNALAPLIDATLFSGDTAPQAPQRALAAYLKWSWLEPLHWHGGRGDIEMVVVYGSGFHKCYAVDALGNVLASRVRQNDAWSARWLRRTDDAEGFSVTLHEQDPALRDGEAAAVQAFAADAGTGEITSVRLSGRDAGLREVVARYSVDAASGRLDLHIGVEERAEIGPDGRVARSMQRPCFDPDAPCEEPWEATVYTYDDAGNPVRRETDLDGERHSEAIAVVTNGRGDWIELRVEDGDDTAGTVRRAIIYRK